MDNHSSGICVTTYLKQPTRMQCGSHHSIPIWFCSERGLPCHTLLPVARCALTTPFHPYLLIEINRRYFFCGTFRRFTSPRRYLAFYPMEPGLSSLLFYTAVKTKQRLPDQLKTGLYQKNLTESRIKTNSYKINGD